MFYRRGDTRSAPGYGQPVKRGGFSLLELAVSLLIISAGIVTIMPNLSQGARMSNRARGLVTAVQLARNLMNELQLEKKVKEDKGDGIFEDFEDYSYEYAIEHVKLDEILVDVSREDNQNSMKGDLIVKRLYKVIVTINWQRGSEENTYEAFSFLYGEK